MGTISAFIMLTIDGFYEGEGGAFDFWELDDEFERFSDSQLDEFDVLVFGRTTYAGMADYWPTPEAAQESPGTARRMNGKPKVVVSTTLSSPTWSSTVAVTALDDLATRRRDRDESMLVLGSPRLVGALIENGLLDELRIMVNPVVIGRGSAFGSALGRRLVHALRDVRRIGAGNVLMTYAPQ